MDTKTKTYRFWKLSGSAAGLVVLLAILVAVNVIVGGFSVAVLSPMYCRIAVAPVRVMPENRSTVSPPPVSPVLVAVTMVLVAELISALRTEIHIAIAVPPPVDSGAVADPSRV